MNKKLFWWTAACVGGEWILLDDESAMTPAQAMNLCSRELKNRSAQRGSEYIVTAVKAVSKYGTGMEVRITRTS